MKDEYAYVTGNVARLRGAIEECARRAGRKASEITLVAVSKDHPVEAVNSAVRAGVRQIGESRVQEAEGKFAGLRREFTLRMVGHLQRNKAGKAARLFDAVDSVDSMRLAEKLNDEMKDRGGVMPVLVQVNVTADPAKGGFAAGELPGALDECAKMKNLKVEGLMTIGPLTDDAAAVRDSFREMKRIFDEQKTRRRGLRILSMGMSDDFEIAVEEGSTMLRIGRAVFERR
ncbi:MAG: YggS family pyridoxal phosphate-dependent enzyme [bacterium]